MIKILISNSFTLFAVTISGDSIRWGPADSESSLKLLPLPFSIEQLLISFCTNGTCCRKKKKQFKSKVNRFDISYISISSKIVNFWHSQTSSEMSISNS